MVREELLIQKFNEETTGKNQRDGLRVYNNDLVIFFNIINEDYLICIDGKVISENLFNEYNTKIEIDAKNKSILSTYCTCSDFEKNSLKKDNYSCKHLVATFHKSLNSLTENELLNKYNNEDVDEGNKKIFRTKANSILSMLLNDDKEKEEIKFEVYINRHEWSDKITAEFKIGLKSVGSNGLYILKDIEQFLVAYENNVPVKYSKHFTFCRKYHKLSTKDRQLIDFIRTIRQMESPYRSYSSRSREKNIDGKYLRIPKNLVREFFTIIKKHRVYLNEGFFYKPVETEILMEKPNIDFYLKLMKNEYILRIAEGMPQLLSDKGDVFLYGSTIYLPNYEYCYKVEPYLQVFNNSKAVSFSRKEEEEILRKLIPNLALLSNNIELSKNIKNKIVMKNVQFCFYFHKENEEVLLTTKVKYGEYEFNILNDFTEKIIYRDVKEENRVLSLLRALGFEEKNDKFQFNMGDEYIFRFFKSEIKKLQDLGEVFYSENFKGIKSIGSKGIKGEIKAGKYDYFQFDFKIEDIPKEEFFDILRSFRDKHKYYKLKNGQYLDLEELELKKFLKLVDVISNDNDDINEEYLKIHKNKSLFISNYLEENNIRYLKGKNKFKEVVDNFKKIDEIKFACPEELKANLRDYQKLGFNWFKTLEYLNFGGVLADEMGLGKTLQTITYILSNKEKKSLIIAPTSLIYNWCNEFNRFAPSIKVGVATGAKEERECVFKGIENIDVIITTYNLLKRDLDLYKDINFYNCILDEAQNIKNSNSQNAIAVKEIKAINRFALSGTPIENSLMELWSIFDFIMPGYLYDEKRFSVRYHKKLKEDLVVIEELNKLISPFILRRVKKDVIKELPDKIEKKLVVSLDEEQEKVYSTYAKHVIDLIEKKVKDDEFKNSKIEILSYITKLRQLCLDPSILINDYSGGSGKIESLVDIVKQGVAGDHKILVFSQFTSVLKNIKKRFDKEEISYSYLDGSIPSKKRIDIIEAFNKGKNSVFLISLKSGGTGLNLTSADIVIHFDPWWNPAVEEQATDRAHRIGQKNVVEVIKLIAKGTIEEKVVALQEEKRILISKLINDDLSKNDKLLSLTEDDILELFQLN